MLRDDKLLAYTGSQLLRQSIHHTRESEPSMPLTEENIEKLVHEQDGDSSAPRKPSPDENSSMILGYSQSGVSNAPSRPPLPDKKLRDSERTITKGVVRQA